MRILVAADKFKGSLTAAEVADHLAVGLPQGQPDAEVISCPVADGGEGTIDAASAAGYSVVPAVVDGPLGDPVRVRYATGDGSRAGLTATRVALIELAQSSGLDVLPYDRSGNRRVEPLAATSAGVGHMITAALDDGCDTIVLAVGGSACTDGGAGMVAALGGRLLDAQGRPLPGGGGALTRLAYVDLSGLDARLADATVILAADVDNPLLGEAGAATVFAPQKGAAPEQVSTLETGLTRWRDAVAHTLGGGALAAADLPGAGAAGGVGFAALAVLGAERRSGIDVLLRLTGLADRVADVDLVVTGEGSLDEQSLGGKAPIGVARLAAAAEVPVVAVCGVSPLTDSQLIAAGFERCYRLSDVEPDAQRSVTEAAPLLQQLGERIATEATFSAEDTFSIEPR